jgi:hypothetical protein
VTTLRLPDRGRPPPTVPAVTDAKEQEAAEEDEDGPVTVEAVDPVVAVVAAAAAADIAMGRNEAATIADVVAGYAKLGCLGRALFLR